MLEAADYYDAHCSSGDSRYSHRVIYSPDVPVIRDREGELLAQPYPMSFPTSPAPNVFGLEEGSPEIETLGQIFTERAERVLAVAAHHGARELVLGAWGCGAFGNDPVMVGFRGSVRGDGCLADQGSHPREPGQAYGVSRASSPAIG
ncbi:TIGR02452 family protein [Nocardia huaxiensis]|nr:TIGR02452 family protein [Nocardia huaxiensis]UFS99792.1 TIGR02452 family protein [Nocardia huaxiensis]